MNQSGGEIGGKKTMWIIRIIVKQEGSYVLVFKVDEKEHGTKVSGGMFMDARMKGKGR